MLICAPSNAAVDEIVNRLRASPPTKDGRLYNAEKEKANKGEMLNYND